MINEIEQSNQLNLTVVALVALVAIVGLVALVINAASIPDATYSNKNTLSTKQTNIVGDAIQYQCASIEECHGCEGPGMPDCINN